MKTYITALLCLLSVLALTAQEKKVDFKAHPFFKLLAGEWKSEGALTDKDGKVITIAEEWKGRVTDEGTFVMEGSLRIDDKQQDVRWTFSHNSATDSYVAERVELGGGDSKTFQVSVSDVTLSMELKALLDGDGAITLKESFADEKHDTLKSEVSVTSATSEIQFSGTVTHKRVKP